MKNWKTTVTGILGIVSILSTAGFNWFHAGTMPDWGACAGGLVVSIGLIMARDSKPTDLTPPQAEVVKQAVSNGVLPPVAK